MKNWATNLWNAEPARLLAIATAVLSIVTILVPIADELKAAIVALITVLVSGEATRSQVSPVAKPE
jgi:hypothetical protein